MQGLPAVVFLALAGCGGFLSATGANILAWSAFRTRTTGKQWSKLQGTGFVLACTLLNMAGIALFAMSTALGGAVATVMPVQTGANILGNMFWQTILGMKYYNKSMRVGTLVLVLSVAELSEIGPNEPAELPVLELMSEPIAIAWTVFLALSTLVAVYGTYKTYRYPIDSTAKLLCFVSVVTLTTVIGASVGKFFLLVKGAALACVICLYFLDGVFCMTFTVLANAQCDVAIYVPAQLSSQLIVNMLTGYLVWGDSKYVEHPTAYLLVYGLCIMGVYLNSEMDIIGDWTRSYSIRNSMLSEGRAYSRFGHSVLTLLGTWQRGAPPSVENQAELRNLLQLGLETGALQPSEIVELSLLCLRQKGARPNAEMVHWVEHRVKLFKEYCRWDAGFLQAFRRTLSDADLALLRDLEQESETLAGMSTQSFASTTSVLDVAGSNISLGQRDISFGQRDRLL